MDSRANPDTCVRTGNLVRVRYVWKRKFSNLQKKTVDGTCG